MMASSIGQRIEIPASKQDPLKDEKQGLVREIGHLGTWSLSSCKPGYGIERLRDNIFDTFWQSDGQLPHLVNIQFNSKISICQIYIYTDYKLDESYTPLRISLRAGSNFHDMVEFQIVDLNEPSGWIAIPITMDPFFEVKKPLHTFALQIAIICNHQSGRDTHIRQIRIHSPMEDKQHYILESYGTFNTVDFRKFLTIR